MGIGSTLAGMEVPIIGSDSVKWVEVSVPSSSSSSAVAASPPSAPLTEDYASSSGVKESSIHLIWYSLSLSVCCFCSFPNCISLRTSTGQLLLTPPATATGKFTRPYLMPSNCLSSLLIKNFPWWDCESLSQTRSLPSLLSAKIR
jgi:hypothetical protein